MREREREGGRGSETRPGDPGDLGECREVI
jgi:hypothetical protein